MRRVLPPALALALLGAWPSAARADAPLVSETADVIGTGRCQVEAAFARARERAAPTARGLDVLGSCGVLGNSQAALGYTHRVAGDGSASAWRSFMKTTLVAPETGRTGFGLRYGLSATREAGTAWRAQGLELLGMATREVASGLLLHLNLGHVHDRIASQGATSWSLGIETTADTTLAADLTGDDRGKPSVSAGIGRRFNDAFSANTSFSAHLANPRVLTWTLGAKLEF